MENHLKNYQNQKEQTGKSKSSWSEEDVDRLSVALGFVFKTQTTYNEDLDIKNRVQGWKFILEDDFNIEQVLFALKEYMKINRDMPVPADMVKILNPAKPKITQAEYIAAKQWQKDNERFDAFTDAYDTIKSFEEQEKQTREDYSIKCEKIKAIAESSIKRIE